jgi:hypothetical protein
MDHCNPTKWERIEKRNIRQNLRMTAMSKTGRGRREQAWTQAKKTGGRNQSPRPIWFIPREIF